MTWKIQPLVKRIRTHHLCVTGAILYLLSYQSHMRAVVFGFSPLCPVDIIHGLSIWIQSNWLQGWYYGKRAKFCLFAVVPALQSIWFYNTQSDVWYEHFLTKRSGNNKPSSLIIRCVVSCIQSTYEFNGNRCPTVAIKRKVAAILVF